MGNTDARGNVHSNRNGRFETKPKPDQPGGRNTLGSVDGWGTRSVAAALSRLESLAAQDGYRDEGSEEEALWALGEGWRESAPGPSRRTFRRSLSWRIA